MNKNILTTLSSMKNFLSFWLTLVCVTGALGLAYIKDVDITMLLPSLLAIYVGGRTTEKATALYGAMKDPNCSTMDAIKEIVTK